MKKLLILMAVILLTTWTFSGSIGAQEQTGSFWRKILEVAGISATPSTLKGPGDAVETGDIWVAGPDLSTRRQITRDGGYRSPVFEPGDETLLALKESTIVRISLSGKAPEAIFALSGLVKLVGFSGENPDEVLVLREADDGRISVGLFSTVTGKVVLQVPKSREERRMLIHIRGWKRVYGNTVVYVKRETKAAMSGAIQWEDVYIKQGGEDPVNVSRCDGLNCGQPSLSQNGRMVAYIKE